MRILKIIKSGHMTHRRAFAGMNRLLLFTFPFFLSLIWLGCSDFINVDPPKNNLISVTVFKDPATVESAMANLYYSMREQGMTSGSFGLTPVLSIYGDELDYYGFNADQTQLYNHNHSADNNVLWGWWQQAYYLIYGANDIIRGVESSNDLSVDEKKAFHGQALFVRGYVHSLLVSLFGDVPYVNSTNYRENNTVARMAEEKVYDSIIRDLTDAVELLEGIEPISKRRIWPDRYVAKALLARMYLYTENWEMATSTASELIDHFPLETNLSNTFLKGSPETIWQLAADENFPNNTREAGTLIIQTVPGQTYALTDALLASFENGDLRYDNWIGNVSDSNNTTTLYYPHKYKAGVNEKESLEYSILFRSAEQVLIRSEARAHMGNLTGSQTDLNSIRNRAGLSNTTVTTAHGLLEAIQRERRVELFAEQGHRWFDLKRTANAGRALTDLKPNWQETDILLPIPEAELEINPNLLPQNPGY
ncbi:RagB/SusD family nutrient uptake outer membrane protein [Gelidibacter gilvus]|uniref:RagB/SusD family nutrient uptake outer membrane protein n=1 Tax=Gelidibacter gilvus TaxID=59602 RepID=A0A4Q0XF33_9FLAO|nr:RagB/SusD family nutrient uptake outer membrane protein [Gelidibacter gilvus]RXJ45684.1 RagB/SusD family nutrient uptake outer membrane protein [Gelidibacter gilvus]